MALSLQRYMQPEGYSPMIQLLKDRLNRERERAVSFAIPQNADRLHESVIIEILSWLPVRSLLQFKSVCKSWHAIISSDDFISKHLQNYCKKNRDSHGFFVIQHPLHQCEMESYVMFVDETPRVVAHEDLVNTPRFSSDSFYSSYFYGPCDGLYYIYDPMSYPSQRALWNPAIDELKVLPPLITKPCPLANTVFTPGGGYGFGYDVVSRDYKVVLFKGYRNTVDDYSDYPQSVFVYSLKNESWRYCGDLCRYYMFTKQTCYNVLNGSCYWLGSNGYEEDLGIISFNMATDAYEETSIPDYAWPKRYSDRTCLAIYDDAIALLCVHLEAETVDIWALKDEIWTIKFTAGPFQNLSTPIGHWEDNKIILETRSLEGFKLLLLDPELKDVKDLGYQHYTYCNGIFACMESLVSVKGKRCFGRSSLLN